MAEESENTPRQPNPPAARPPPRSSSPAKRPHSDMDDVGKDSMDVDTPAVPARRSSGQSSPRAAKPLSAASQPSVRATSIDMLDAPATGSSAASSETASVSNGDSTATSVSTTNIPTLEDQVGKVLAMLNTPVVDGQEGYVISEKWLERVFARTQENSSRPEEFDKSATIGEIGPVDNSELVDTGMSGCRYICVEHD
jgi:ubiquitin carboxyl-terminal hydrolase 4/11/15